MSSRTLDQIVRMLTARGTRRQVATRCGEVAAGVGLAAGFGLERSEVLARKRKKRCRASRPGNTVTVELFGGRFVCPDEDPEDAALLQLAGTQCTDGSDPECVGSSACRRSESCIAIAKSTGNSEVTLVDGNAGSLAECPDDVPVAAQLSGTFKCSCTCVG